MCKNIHEQYVEELKKVHSNIIVIDKYIDMYTNIVHKCLKCGYEWSVRPYSLLHAKYGCPKCSYVERAKARKLTQEEYKKRVLESNPDVEVIGEYINASTPIKHVCKKCGYGLNGEWLAIPSHIMNGHGCPVCSGNIIGSAPEYKNSIWSQDEYLDFFKDYMSEEQMKTNMPNSHAKIDVICPVCGRHKNISPNILWRQGLGCICSDGISYPNKFMFSFLEQTEIDFNREQSFEWSNGKIYDFYIPSLNCIIECNGAQHYKGWNKVNNSAKLQQLNDEEKYKMAINNGIDKNKYIVIDCSHSNKDFIKHNIEQSNLLNILNINISDVNIEQCDIFATSNLVKRICDMWNDGLAIKQIQEKTKIVAVCEYLKRGNKIGWCNCYTEKEARKRGARCNKGRWVNVYCLELNKVFTSISEAARQTKLNPESIRMCCSCKWNQYNNQHWYYLYDNTMKNGIEVKGAITLGLISEEEALKQLNN